MNKAALCMWATRLFGFCMKFTKYCKPQTITDGKIVFKFWTGLDGQWRYSINDETCKECFADITIAMSHLGNEMFMVLLKQKQDEINKKRTIE